MSTEKRSFVTANESPGLPGYGRPRKYASDSQRVRAYRQRNVRLDVTLPPEIAQTLAEISSDLDCSRNQLLGSLVRFALLNRNWRVMGLFGKR